MIKMLYFAPSRSRKSICTAPRQIVPHMQRCIVIVDQQNGRCTVISKACSWCPYLPTQASQDYVLWRGSRSASSFAVLFVLEVFALLWFAHLCQEFGLKTLPARWQFCSCLPSLCTYPISIDSPLKQVLAYILSKSKAEAFKWSCQKGACFRRTSFWLDLWGDLSQLSYLSIWLSWLHSKVSRKENKCLEIPHHQTKIPKSNHMAFGFSLPPFYHYTPCWRCLLILLETEVAALLIRVIYREMLFWHSTLGWQHTRSVANTATTREKILATWIAG